MKKENRSELSDRAVIFLSYLCNLRNLRIAFPAQQRPRSSQGVSMWLDRVVRLLLPRQGSFFTLLEGVAGKITEAAAVFDELADATGRKQFEKIASRLKPVETAADHLC